MDDRDENNFFWAKYIPASPIINTKGLVVSNGEDTSIGQEGCGSGYTCTYDQRIEAYGCAPLTNTSKMVCCSAGQQNQSPEQWCVDCSNPGKPCHLEPGQLPFCPANGVTGSGCVRMSGKKDEECGPANGATGQGCVR